MPSISSVGSSNSIYGNRNVISGLASGMDTESMIENVVASYTRCDRHSTPFSVANLGKNQHKKRGSPPER